jgi:hypothetical protein
LSNEVKSDFLAKNGQVDKGGFPQASCNGLQAEQSGYPLMAACSFPDGVIRKRK